MNQGERLACAAVFVLGALFCGLDLSTDSGEGAGALHLALEAGLFLGSLVGCIALLRVWWITRRRLATVSRRLDQTRADFQAFQAEAGAYLDGLGKAIDAQFAGWSLSPAEREVGLLMLKGLSFKEIAGLRRTSERTVREQAGALYAKAGLSGRIEFAAFFLEDLMLPRA